MSLSNDLKSEVAEIFRLTWDERDGEVVPEAEALGLGNEAVKLEGTVLYADLAESTDLVQNYKPHFAAEIYKTYLHCASKIIRDAEGVITAFDGDRVMGVFIGNSKNTSAVRCAMKINYAVTKIINPAIKKQYPQSNYVIGHAVGVDTSELFIARTGVRGSNDLVWVGRAANYAAKMCGLRDASYPTWITEDVYDNMHKSVRFSENGTGVNMWEKRTWNARGITVYRSSWWWSI